MKLLRTIQDVSMAGAGRTIQQYVDGDGAYSFKVKGDALNDIDKLTSDEMEQDTINVRGVD